MRIEEALDKFVIQLRADGRSPHTIRQYQRHTRLFAAWARDVAPCGDEIDKLDHEAVARFLASPAATERAGGGMKAAVTTNALRSSLRNFFAYLHKAGHVGADPGRLIRRARCTPPPPRGMSDDEQTKFLSALAASVGPEAERDHALFATMLYTGLRLGSAIGLDVGDVDLVAAQVTVRRMKGDAPDRVLLNDSAKTHLMKFLAGRASGPVFLANGRRISKRHVQRRFTQWVKAAGITSNVSCHSLRHAFGMRVYRACGDVLLVKEAMRHRSVASTMVYVRSDQSRLRSALG